MSNETWKELWERIKTERDELRVRMHLARADLKDEWEEVEKKWESAQDRLEEAFEDAGEAAREVQATLKIVGEEIADTYSRIRKRLDEEDD